LVILPSHEVKLERENGISAQHPQWIWWPVAGRRGDRLRCPDDPPRIGLHGTLSREHNVSVDVPETELDARFQRPANRCKTDSAHHCTILQSDVSTGQFAPGLIKLRIDPGAVEELISFAASLGTLEHRSTQVEDLGEAIQDTQLRVEMLNNYRKQLLELQSKATTNIDAAIKIASELSTVQSKSRRTGKRPFR
jgi:hypothetical protein